MNQQIVVPKAPSLAWRIRVRFADNRAPREYVTADIRRENPGWDSEAFNRQIESLEVFLPTGHAIVMAGMEAYNFFVEATQDMGGKGGAKIEAFWFCGKIPKVPVTELWSVRQGRVVHDRKPYGQEWGGTATRGWKLGKVGARVTSRIIQI
jgi:hypothetical protein